MENFDFNIRKFNTSNIYSYFLDHDHATKQDLATSLNLTLPTVNKNIDYLTELGLIQASGSRGQTGGRRATTYSLCAEAKIALGLDITKHHVSCVAVDLNGKIISFKRNRLVFEYKDSYFKEVWDLLKKFISDNHFEDDKILGVGIGIPALVQADNRTVFYSRIMGFEEGTYDMFKKYNIDPLKRLMKGQDPNSRTLIFNPCLPPESTEYRNTYEKSLKAVES